MQTFARRITTCAFWLAALLVLEALPPCLNGTVSFSLPGHAHELGRPGSCLRSTMCNSTRTGPGAYAPVFLEKQEEQAASMKTYNTTAHVIRGHQERGILSSQEGRMREQDALESRMHTVLARKIQRSQHDIEFDPTDFRPSMASRWLGVSPRYPLSHDESPLVNELPLGGHHTAPDTDMTTGHIWDGGKEGQAETMQPGLLRARLAHEQLGMCTEYLPQSQGLDQVRTMLQWDLESAGAGDGEQFTPFMHPARASLERDCPAPFMSQNEQGEYGGDNAQDAPVWARSANGCPPRRAYDAISATNGRLRDSRQVEAEVALLALDDRDEMDHDPLEHVSGMKTLAFAGCF
jgi:hypothetical protein